MFLEREKPMKKARITKINDRTYRFTEAAFGADVYMYLLIGNQKALLTDTGYGFTDVPDAIRAITDKELIVVNTHGHMDHIHGNHLYNEVYLAAEDEETFQRHTSKEYLTSLIQEIARENNIPQWIIHVPFIHRYIESIIIAKPSRHIPLPQDMQFDLGGRTVRIVKTPGHTSGSICLLDEKYHFLFTGDMTCHDGVLLNFPESTAVSIFRNSILAIKVLCEKEHVVSLFPGHQNTPEPTEILDSYLLLCEKLLSSHDPEVWKSGRITDGTTTIRFRPEKEGE